MDSPTFNKQLRALWELRGRPSYNSIGVASGISGQAVAQAIRGETFPRRNYAVNIVSTLCEGDSEMFREAMKVYDAENVARRPVKAVDLPSPFAIVNGQERVGQMVQSLRREIPTSVRPGLSMAGLAAELREMRDTLDALIELIERDLS